MAALIPIFDIEPHMQGRRFKGRSEQALRALARDINRSHREIAREHGVDATYLHGLARSIPGLIEARRAWREGFRAGRKAA